FSAGGLVSWFDPAPREDLAVNPYASPLARPVAAGPRRPAATKRLGLLKGWGWVEWTIAIQTALAAALFVPPIAHSKARIIFRIAAYAIGLVSWGAVLLWGKPGPRRVFPAVPWLTACTVWLGVSIFHPTTNSLVAGVATFAFNVAIM